MTAPTLGVLVPELTPLTWTVVAVVLLVLAVVTVTCVLRARRLDALHRRTDAARAGLADALDRRGTVALRVADALALRDPAGVDPPRGPVRPSRGARPVPAVSLRGADAGAGWSAGPLRAAATDALAASRTCLGTPGGGLDACEVAENTLTRRLAAVDRGALPAGLAGELVDAEQLTVLARRVHNDAVRDTLDLRSRRLVRWLRLAGTAPVPAYFEIADPPRPADRRPATGPRPAAGPDVARLP